MVLHLIGIGLYDEKDISLRGLEIVKKCDKVYLEHYTSILGIDKTKLEKLYGREVIIASRDFVEKLSDTKLIKESKDKDNALLIVGDVFGATTHTDLMLRAKKENVDVNIVFNASVINAVGIVGLELYKYGKATSIVFPDNNWLPNTPYEVIKNNKKMGLHTLCLLDIKVAEPSRYNLLRAAKGMPVEPMPPRYMTVKEGLEVLEKLEEQNNENIITSTTKIIGVSRLGHPNYKIFYGTIEELKNIDFGEPLHSIIIPGKTHHIEDEALEQWSLEQ